MSAEQHYDSETIQNQYQKKYAAATATASDRYEAKIAQRLVKAAIRKYAPAGFTPLRCIDLGCGLGHKTAGLLGIFAHVLGVDISENAVKRATAMYASTSLNFSTANVLDEPVPEPFDMVTAFGFSPFNVSDPKTKAETIATVVKKLCKPGKGLLILSSFTNFSGTSPSGWFQHTQAQLDQVLKHLNDTTGIAAELYFYQTDTRYLFGFGLINFAAELRKLIFRKKRNYLILVRYE